MEKVIYNALAKVLEDNLRKKYPGNTFKVVVNDDLTQSVTVDGDDIDQRVIEDYVNAWYEGAGAVSQLFEHAQNFIGVVPTKGLA